MTRAVAALLACAGCLDASPSEAPPGDAAPPADAAPLCDEECCPASALVETFDGDIGDRWETISTSEECEVAPADGELVIANRGAGETDGCQVHTRERYRLAGESASVEISRPGTGQPALIYFVEMSSGEAIEFSRRTDGLHLGVTPAGGNTGDLVVFEFDHGEHHYLRFVGDPDGDGVAFEASGDGATWSTLFLYMLEVPGTSDCVVLGLGTYGGTDSELEGAFDNVNVPP